MGIKAKKAMRMILKRATTNKPSKDDDFLVVLLANNLNMVLYVGRIPHGFYEEDMEDFGQFGTIKRLKIARNKRTGKARHFGFIEFESPEVAKIVDDTMHNYLLFEHLLQYRTLEEAKKLVEKIMKHDKTRRKRIEASGIDYECPKIVGNIQPVPKKIKFERLRWLPVSSSLKERAI